MSCLAEVCALTTIILVKWMLCYQSWRLAGFAGWWLHV